jgi:hypothetical protein
MQKPSPTTPKHELIVRITASMRSDKKNGIRREK